jgi:methylated-DNA-[protein]-cysteine S-methyltransferase
LVIIADPCSKLRAIDWTDHHQRMTQLLDRFYGQGRYTLTPRRDPGGLTQALKRYFKGEISVLQDLPVETHGTAFQTRIWTALRTIKGGSTMSYGELAQSIGKPRAVRAAGLANGQNPISIVIPCHRVIGANGSLTGYGGGLHRKHWLLAHEGALPPR